MRKCLKVISGYFRLLKEEVLNGFKIKLHGIQYCINSGVKFWIHSKGQCDIGKKTWIAENSIFECDGGKLHLGYNNFFNSNCRISSMDSITICDNNLFGPNVVIVDHDHKFDNQEVLICKQDYIKSPVQIGSNIWVGGNVTICKGVTICDKVVIGANSIVTKSITESGVYAGNPLRKLQDV